MQRTVRVSISWDLIEHDDIGAVEEFDQEHDQVSDAELLDEAIRVFLDGLNTADNDGDLTKMVDASIILSQPHEDWEPIKENFGNPALDEDLLR